MIRNAVGKQYKGRKYADRYAAGLQESWGGEQSNGSFVEVVVDTLDTAEGRRYQVMCVTTPAAEREPVVQNQPVTREQLKALRAEYVGQSIQLGATTYRISQVSDRIYNQNFLDVYLELLSTDGRYVNGRTWSILTPAELAEKVAAAK